MTEGSRVNRMPRLRFVDETHKRFDISRREKNIRPRVVVVQDVIESRIDDRSCDTCHTSE